MVQKGPWICLSEEAASQIHESCSNAPLSLNRMAEQAEKVAAIKLLVL